MKQYPNAPLIFSPALDDWVRADSPMAGIAGQKWRTQQRAAQQAQPQQQVQQKPQGLFPTNPQDQLQAALPSVPPAQDPVQQKAAAAMDPMQLIQAYQQMQPIFNLWNPAQLQSQMQQTRPSFAQQVSPYMGLLSYLQQQRPMTGSVPQGALSQIGPAIFGGGNPNMGLVAQRPQQQFPLGVTPQVPQRPGNDYGGVWDYLF